MECKMCGKLLYEEVMEGAFEQGICCECEVTNSIGTYFVEEEQQMLKHKKINCPECNKEYDGLIQNEWTKENNYDDLFSSDILAVEECCGGEMCGCNGMPVPLVQCSCGYYFL